MMIGNYISGMMPRMMQNYGIPSLNSWMWPAVFAMFLLFLGIWVYTSLAYMEIAKKLKYKSSGLVWIPFVRGAIILQLGGFSWALIFLLLVPILGWIAVYILSIIALWRIFEKRKHPGWLVLIPLAGVIPYLSVFAAIAFLIILGFVAWQDKKKRR